MLTRIEVKIIWKKKANEKTRKREYILVLKIKIKYLVNTQEILRKACRQNVNNVKFINFLSNYTDFLRH